jgi:hypothetical protein
LLVPPEKRTRTDDDDDDEHEHEQEDEREDEEAWTDREIDYLEVKLNPGSPL